MRLPLRLRLAAVIALVTALSLGAASWLLVDVNRSAMEEATREQLFASIGDLSHTVGRQVSDREAELTTIARTLADDSLSADQRVALVASRIEASTALSAVAVYDDRGALVDEVREPGAPVPAYATLPEDLRAEARARSMVVGPVSVHEARARIVLVAAVPGTRTTWYLAATVGLDELQDRVERLAQDNLGGDVESLAVVDDTYQVVAHANPERVGESADSLRAWIGAPMFASGELAIFTEIDEPRGRLVAAARRVEGAPWVVIARRPRAQVYASIGRMQRTVVVVFGATLVIAVLAALLVARYVTRPVARLVDFAGALAQRDWDREVVVRTGDELETLADAMSRAARELAESERRLGRERQLRGDLGRYLPAGLAERIAAAEHSLALGGERRAITVLFADVTSFTRLAEQRPPEQVAQLLNQLFSILTELVFRHGGTVDKFIGDCLMAVWGAPASQPDHAARAVAAGRDMLRWLDAGNEVWAAKLGQPIHLAIGINSGDAIVGNLGSEARMEYTCIGDAVNVAARLEALARPQQILISRATRERIPFSCTPLGAHDLAGRTDPVELFEVHV